LEDAIDRLGPGQPSVLDTERGGPENDSMLPSRKLLLATACAAGLLPGEPLRAQQEKAPDVASPGLDFSVLAPPQLEVARQVLKSSFCYCGCPHTLDGCLREHASCHHARRMASLVLRMARRSMTEVAIEKVLTDYYASFDSHKRARLDVKAFGPPLGSANAKVAIVEFSDFSCPYCQALRPELERFVQENEGRVKLYYKPFPIASHPRAMEAALAVEWARDKGLFWKMHDRLFENASAFSDDDLARQAAASGGDPEDLRKALEEGRNRTRIAASQGEARKAGLEGTPTLYLNGRRLNVPVPAGEMRDILLFTLEDEEEWMGHGGWARD